MIKSWGSYTFLFYAVLDIVMAVLVYIFVKETKNKTLEEMETIFHSRAAFDVEAARKKALESGSEDRFSEVQVHGKAPSVNEGVLR